MQCKARLSIGVRRIQIYAEREAEEVTKQCAEFLTFNRDGTRQHLDDSAQQGTLPEPKILHSWPIVLFF